jgi:hypothetical protein
MQRVVEPTIIHPEAVADFHRRRGTEALARQAVRLVQETFPELESITLQAVQDQEEDTEWLRLTVTARLAPAQMRAAHRECLTRWVSASPPETRHLICITYRAS